jgi:hypothetical protein
LRKGIEVGLFPRFLSLSATARSCCKSTLSCLPQVRVLAGAVGACYFHRQITFTARCCRGAGAKYPRHNWVVRWSDDPQHSIKDARLIGITDLIGCFSASAMLHTHHCWLLMLLDEVERAWRVSIEHFERSKMGKWVRCWDSNTKAPSKLTRLDFAACYISSVRRLWHIFRVEERTFQSVWKM